MKSSAKKIELASVDDLFSTEEGRQDAKLEKIQELPLSELHPFKNHPFKVKDDEAMMETADSIKQYGVLVPAIARPDPEGGYELVAGHRRHRASELADKETMPVIVRDLDDDAATIIMVDSNLQRESLLPSERAFAYKMKLEAVKHQGARTDLTSRQVGEKSQTSIQKVADQAGESQRQVQRYIRLTELIPELMDMVDEKKIALNPAYELSFLKKEEQVDLLDAMDSEQATPSLSQAQRLKKYSQEGHLTLDMMRVIMGEEKKSDLDKVTFTSDTLRKYFPKSYTPQRMQETTRGLASICKEGVDAIGSALKELETAGYIVRRQLRGTNGRITDTEYVIYEQPQPDMSQPDTASPDTENPDMVKPDTEKPAELNIEKSNTEKSITYGSSTDSIPFRETAAARPPERKGRDAMSVTEIENYRELILENIEYDCLKQRYPLYLDDLNEIVELLVETVCAKRKTTRISGADFPHEIVRSRFLKLDSSHIEFVMDCLQKNTTQVRNMKQYLLAVLFNAPTTMNNHFTSLVNHDMHAGGW